VVVLFGDFLEVLLMLKSLFSFFLEDFFGFLEFQRELGPYFLELGDFPEYFFSLIGVVVFQQRDFLSVIELK
jgi:hypothetical protein